MREYWGEEHHSVVGGLDSGGASSIERIQDELSSSEFCGCLRVVIDGTDKSVWAFVSSSCIDVASEECTVTAMNRFYLKDGILRKSDANFALDYFQFALNFIGKDAAESLAQLS